MRLKISKIDQEKISCTIATRKGLFFTKDQVRWLRKLAGDRGAICKRRFFNRMIFYFSQYSDLNQFIRTFEIDAIGV